MSSKPLILITLPALLAVPAWAAPAPTLIRPAGAEVVVQAADAAPAVALDAFGFASVAWLEAEPDKPARIWVRRYDTRFQPAGDAYLAYEIEGTPVWGLRVTVARRGRLLLTWSQGRPDTPTSQWQLRDTDGTLLAKDDLGDGSGPAGPVVTGVDAAGRFVLAWAEDDGLYGQSLLADGSLSVRRRALVAGARGALEPRALAVSPSGRCVAFWRDNDAAPTKSYGRRFGADLAPLAAAFDVAGVDAAVEARGRLVVAWVTGSGTQAQAYVRLLSGSGAALGAPITVHTGAWSDRVSLAADGPGNFVVAYRGAATGGGGDVFARRFRPNAEADGRPFRLADSAGARTLPVLAGNPAGDVVAAWRQAQGAAVQLRARPFRVPPKGDFNGDLKSDLVLYRERDGATRVWNMSEGRRGANLRVWRAVPGRDFTPVAADDFDGDRRQDLLFQHRVTGALAVALMGGREGIESCAVARLSPDPPAGARLAASGDLDQDGWADLVFQDETSGALTVWKMEGLTRAGALTPSPASPPDGTFLLSGVQDYDGDGVRDLLWLNRGAGRVVQWLLDPDLARTSSRLTNPPQAAGAEWELVASADYGVGPGGRTGTHDAVWRSATTERLVIWFFDFSGARTAGIFTTPARPSDGDWTVVAPR